MISLFLLIVPSQGIDLLQLIVIFQHLYNWRVVRAVACFFLFEHFSGNSRVFAVNWGEGDLWLVWCWCWISRICMTFVCSTKVVLFNWELFDVLDHNGVAIAWVWPSFLVVVNQLVVDGLSVDVIFLACHRLLVGLAHLLGLTSFLVVVVESAYLRLVAPGSVAVGTFVLVGMVQFLHGGVRLVAKQTFGTEFPGVNGVFGVGYVLAVFSWVLEDFWGSSKVSHVVGVDALFGVVRILAVRTKTRLVAEHVELEHVNCFEDDV